MMLCDPLLRGLALGTCNRILHISRNMRACVTPISGVVTNIIGAVVIILHALLITDPGDVGSGEVAARHWSIFSIDILGRATFIVALEPRVFRMCGDGAHSVPLLVD